MQGVLQPSPWVPDPVHLLAQYFHPPRPPRIAHCRCISPSDAKYHDGAQVNHHFSTSKTPTKHFCLSALTHSLNPSDMPPTKPRKRRGKHPPAADQITNQPSPTSRTTPGELDVAGHGGNSEMLLHLGAVSYLDCLVFLLLLAPQLLWHVGLVATASCALLAVPFLGSPLTRPPSHIQFYADSSTVTLPLTIIKERHWQKERGLFIQRATFFEDLVIRCVRYAFANVPTNIGRVFLSKGVALPFFWFRMMRRGYLGAPVHWHEYQEVRLHRPCLGGTGADYDRMGSKGYGWRAIRRRSRIW